MGLVDCGFHCGVILLGHLVGKSLMSIYLLFLVGLVGILREYTSENSIPKFCMKGIILAASILGAQYEKVVGLNIWYIKQHFIPWF